MDRKQEIYQKRIKNLEKARAARAAKSGTERKPRAPRVRKTKAELKKIRSEAGKKGAATRWANYRKKHEKVNKEFDVVVRALVDKPLKLNVDFPIESPEPITPPKRRSTKAIMEAPKSDIHKKDTEQIPVEVAERTADVSDKALDFVQDIAYTSEEIVKCLRKIQSKGIMDKTTLKMCGDVTARGYKQLYDVYNNFENHLHMLQGVDKKIRNELIESVDDLSKHLTQFSALITTRLI